MKRSNLLSLCICFTVATSPERLRSEELTSIVLDDGVVHFEITPGESKTTRFEDGILRFFGTLWKKDKRPFGRTVAFVVCVSEYETLKDLKHVQADKELTIDALINRCQVDDIFVASEEIVTRSLLEKYLQAFLLTGRSDSKLSEEDRFIFYFSGHGGARGTTGYLKFSKSTEEVILGDNVISITELLTLMQDSKVKHICSILDSCQSGRLFSLKGERFKIEQNLAVERALSGKGSKHLISAATDSQDAIQGIDSSLFTSALVKALGSEGGDSNNDGFLTLEEIYGALHTDVQIDAKLSYGRDQQPDFMQVTSSDGTLNASDQGTFFSSSQIKSLRHQGP